MIKPTFLSQEMLHTHLSPAQDPKGPGSDDPRVREVARGLVAQFTYQLLKDMRNSIGEDGLLGRSPAQETVDQLFDQELADVIAGQDGPLVEEIVRSLSRYVR